MNKIENVSLLSEEEISAWNIIQKAETIIITSHIHPDGDAVGSSLAMLHYCRSLGKQVRINDGEAAERVFVERIGKWLEQCSG